MIFKITTFRNAKEDGTYEFRMRLQEERTKNKIVSHSTVAQANLKNVENVKYYDLVKRQCSSKSTAQTLSRKLDRKFKDFNLKLTGESECQQYIFLLFETFTSVLSIANNQIYVSPINGIIRNWKEIKSKYSTDSALFNAEATLVDRRNVDQLISVSKEKSGDETFQVLMLKKELEHTQDEVRELKAGIDELATNLEKENIRSKNLSIELKEQKVELKAALASANDKEFYKDQLEEAISELNRLRNLKA